MNPRLQWIMRKSWFCNNFTTGIIWQWEAKSKKSFFFSLFVVTVCKERYHFYKERNVLFVHLQIKIHHPFTLKDIIVAFHLHIKRTFIKMNSMSTLFVQNLAQRTKTHFWFSGSHRLKSLLIYWTNKNPN